MLVFPGGTAMTEVEWLGGEKFDSLYDHVKETPRCSRRVRLLLGVATARRIAHLYPDPLCQEAIDLVEQIADGEASVRKLPAMHRRIQVLTEGAPTTTPADGDWPGEPHVEVVPVEALGVVYWLTWDVNKADTIYTRVGDLFGLIASQQAGVMPKHLPYEAIPSYWNSKEVDAGKAAEERHTCALLRDVLGNPFRPVKFARKWRTETVRMLAQQMYQSRDFSAMPILADALLDAGCDGADILEHCRGSGPHVRGCWAVDGLLGKK
jgi:hypothetical protein